VAQGGLGPRWPGWARLKRAATKPMNRWWDGTVNAVVQALGGRRRESRTRREALSGRSPACRGRWIRSSGLVEQQRLQPLGRQWAAKKNRRIWAVRGRNS